ncbi:unnamed protein product, partial [Meganyctiphanes norvegica]
QGRSTTDPFQQQQTAHLYNWVYQLFTSSVLSVSTMKPWVWVTSMLLVLGASLLPLVSAGDYGDDLVQLRQLYRSLAMQSGCPDPPPNISDGPALPTVPKSFMTNMEVQMLEDGDNSKKVLYGMEGYDNDQLRGIINYRLMEGIVHDRPFLLEEEIRYNVPLDEALFLYSNKACDIVGDDNCVPERDCHAKKLKDVSDELQQLFGFVSNSDESGFMGASGILEFGPQFGYWPSKLAEACRGMDCYKFQTCLEKPDENATVWYTYYWTTPEWSAQNNNNGKQVPVRVEIYGVGKWEGQFVRDVMQTIDFFDYKRWVKPGRNLLEQPADVFCVGKVDTIAPPVMKDYFWYKSETVMGFTIPVPDGGDKNYTETIDARAVFPREEYYDFISRITRVDYTPFFLFGNDRRFEYRTMRIHDFNQGLSYHIRPVQQFCNVSKIENMTSWGDVVVEPDGSVHMAMPVNFEDMDMPYQYNGIHLIRGLEAGVWAGVKANPLLDNKTETYVWYYASPLTHDWEGFREDPPHSLDRVPVKLEKYLTGQKVHPHQVYNIFNYESNVPHLASHDISICYKDSNMRHFRFDLPDDALNKTLYQKEHLVYYTQGALAEVANVSPLRINRIKLEVSYPKISIIFTILGRPKNAINGAAGLNEESTIGQAVDLIRTALDSSQLVIPVHLINNENELPIIIVAKPHTMESITRFDDITKGTEIQHGYSPGDMAGLGIGMVILGALLGFAGLYYLNSRK